MDSHVAWWAEGELEVERRVEPRCLHAVDEPTVELGNVRAGRDLLEEAAPHALVGGETGQPRLGSAIAEDHAGFVDQEGDSPGNVADSRSRAMGRAGRTWVPCTRRTCPSSAWTTRPTLVT